MASQHIVWIAVPGGYRSPRGSNRVLVSVFVSPQLHLDGSTLSGCDFVNWPARLLAGDVRFNVHFGDQPVPATMRSTPDSELWAALFDANTFVRQYTPDEDSGLVGSYHAARLHDLVKTAYQQTFDTSPLDPTPDEIPAALTELRQMFTHAESLADPIGSDDAARVLFGRDLFRPATAEEKLRRMNRLVDLAREQLAQRRQHGDRTVAGEIMPETGDPADELVRFAIFHSQPTGTGPAPLAPTPDDTRIDFHQQLTRLGEYPVLGRALGLIIDLEVDVTGVPHTAPGAHGLLRVAPHFLTPLVPGATPITPTTAFILDDNGFHAAAAPGSNAESVDEMLNLAVTGPTGEPQFRLIQVDIDHAGFATIDLLSRAAGASIDGTLAALRSSGVSITRHANAPRLMETIAAGLHKMANLSAGQQDITLFADDLLRGYRVDVRDTGSSSWHSLHHRVGTYQSTAQQEQRVIHDEGFVQPTLIQPVSGTTESTIHDPTAPNYAPESLFLWQGWSMAAARPGQVMPQPNAPAPSPPPPTPVNDSKLRVSFKAAPHTLPRLRFGHNYEFRMRLVDLVGGGPTVDQADAALAAMQASGDPLPVLPARGEGFCYQRFDVVPSPVVLPRIKPGAGASVERVVLRSNHDMTPAHYAAQYPQNPELAISGERHIVAPKTWQLLAEAHGLFDTSIGSGADIAHTHSLLQRAEQSLADDEVHPEPAVSVPYLPDPLAVGAALGDLPGVPDRTVGGVVSDELRFDEALLPDPVANPRSVITIGFGPQSEWPQTRGFRLRLDEGTQAPIWNSADRVLTVFLPKGETRTIKLSSDLPGASTLPLLGMWGWLSEWLDRLVDSGKITDEQRAAREEQLRRLAILGQLWMLTPPKELTLVHAVQQPVQAPVIERINAIRLPGNTYAYIDAAVRVHGNSTGQLELCACWRERVDGPPEDSIDMTAPVLPTPFVLPSADHSTPAPVDGDLLPVASFSDAQGTVNFIAPDLAAMDARVDRAISAVTQDCAALVSAANTLVPPDPWAMASARALRDQALDKTAAKALPIPEKWRTLSNTAADIERTALSYDTDPDLPPNLPEFPQQLKDIADRIAQSAKELGATALHVIDDLDRFAARHEFGDTKYRRVTYRAVATSRFGDCFDDPDLDLTRTSPELTVDVLSTAPPKPVSVQYVIPAFAWSRQVDGNRYESNRDGLLRIYLQRPWFTSGDGELLGVVVADDPQPAGSPQLLNSLSQWGRDPLWATENPGAFLTRGDFHNAVTVMQGLRPPDRERRPVTVLGFAVQFEGDRCFADVFLGRENRSYYPFVRLAVTRLQPKSVPGAEISPVVLTDFAQMTPRRTVSVVRREPSLLHVVISGLTHHSFTDPAHPGPTGTRVRVSVQERIPGTVDDAGWITIDDAIVTEEALLGQLWDGTVRLPNRAPVMLRLLIEELEDHPLIQLGDLESAERLVFAETVNI